MSEDTIEPKSLELLLNNAILTMNSKLKDQGYNERERAFMWGMTVTEQREFLTMIWDQVHNDPQHIDSLTESSARFRKTQQEKTEQDAQIDKLHGSSAAEVLEKAIADRSVFSDNDIEDISTASQEETLGVGPDDEPVEQVKPVSPKPGPPTKSVQTNN